MEDQHHLETTLLQLGGNILQNILQAQEKVVAGMMEEVHLSLQMVQHIADIIMVEVAEAEAIL